MREILLAFKNKCVTPQNRQSSQNIIGLNEKARIFVSSLNAFFFKWFDTRAPCLHFTGDRIHEQTKISDLKTILSRSSANNI